MGDSISLALFVIMAVLAMASAIMVIIGRNLFHTAMYLGAYLLVIAGLYFLLNADLAGIMQIFVYVGGVIVVLLFGVMLTPRIASVRLVMAAEKPWLTVVEVGVITGVLIAMINAARFYMPAAAPVKDAPSLIGRLFLTEYLLPFEVISVLLLAALIGAVVIAREEATQ